MYSLFILLLFFLFQLPQLFCFYLPDLLLLHNNTNPLFVFLFCEYVRHILID